MPSVQTLANSNAARPSGWLRGPFFDIALIGFPWVVFYLWVTLGLGLGRAGVGLKPLGAAADFEALALATVVALACTYVHRHYTFLLVYGDPATFSQMAQRFVVSPLIIFTVVAIARLASNDRTPGAISLWGILQVIMGIWVIWHTVQQRYGILRIYGGKARGGLETPEAGKRDQALFWGMTAITTGVLVGARRELFTKHPNAKRLVQILEPIVLSWPGRLATAALIAGGLWFVARWIQAETQAKISASSRAARLWFVSSTAALFVVFIAHGPIVGYLCFGVAHALEYLAFVHHFGYAKLGGKPKGSIAAVCLGRPFLFGPLLIAFALGVFYLLRDERLSDAYTIYYSGTSILHFLYDGWIWKVRKPAVGKPLGVRIRTAKSS